MRKLSAIFAVVLLAFHFADAGALSPDPRTPSRAHNAPGRAAPVPQAPRTPGQQQTPQPGQPQQAAAPQPSARTPVGSAPPAARQPVSARAATSPQVARSAAAQPTPPRAAAPQTQARTATPQQEPLGQRTPAFDDLTRIGGGYAACHAAYTACMDQGCANANSTFRRCICSDRFRELQRRDDMFAQALSMLQDFAENDLHAVSLSAERAAAMNALVTPPPRRATSHTGNTLTNIRDLLAGRRVQGVQSRVAPRLDLTDIWGGMSAPDPFAPRDNLRVSPTLDGAALHAELNRQCTNNAAVRAACENEAALNMVRNTFLVAINNDCAAAERRTNDRRVALDARVREAEMELRDARLDAFRLSNSTSVNECISQVRTAMTADSVCGEGWRRCLDPTGQLINPNTGEIHFRPGLFELATATRLDVSVLPAVTNPQLAGFLNHQRMHAERILSTCRDDANLVWNRFVNETIIEISQAQARKIDEIRMSCVGVIVDCYDEQMGQARTLTDGRTADSNALNAFITISNCRDAVATCAALFAGANAQRCEFDARGSITNIDACGLRALLNFVSGVNSVRVFEACEQDLERFIMELCADEVENREWPYACRTKSITELRRLMTAEAHKHCADLNGNLPDGILATAQSWDELWRDHSVIGRVLSTITGTMTSILSVICTEHPNGVWYGRGSALDPNRLEPTWHNTVFGGRRPPRSTDIRGIPYSDWGFCVLNSPRVQCEQADEFANDMGYAVWNERRGECELLPQWAVEVCTEILGGFWDESQQSCYILRD